jgi:hypothetical protein
VIRDFGFRFAQTSKTPRMRVVACQEITGNSIGLNEGVSLLMAHKGLPFDRQLSWLTVFDPCKASS